ncbi:MAG: HEPN domain-containing protein [Syntrophothermus sp.]
MEKDDMLSYWLDMAERDYETMKHLYASHDFHWSLFMGHLVIEKLLKALLVFRQGEGGSIPRSHDLLLLAEKAGVETNGRQKDLLDLITTFNINARYPDYKQSFYRKCTPTYTAERLREIEELRTWLLSKLKS